MIINNYLKQNIFFCENCEVCRNLADTYQQHILIFIILFLVIRRKVTKLLYS